MVVTFLRFSFSLHDSSSTMPVLTYPPSSSLLAVLVSSLSPYREALLSTLGGMVAVYITFRAGKYLYVRRKVGYHCFLAEMSPN